MIYLTLVLVLLPGVGWTANKTIEGADSYANVVCPPGPGSPAKAYSYCSAKADAGCHAKMEAAMRAMEPFILPLIYTDPLDGPIVRYPPFNVSADHQVALKQWQAVKHECWREK